MRKTLLACAVACAPSCAWAQNAGQAYGGYQANPITLQDLQTEILQLDNKGNLKVDCILGCSGGSGSGGTVAQGAPAANSNAWPFYLTQGGAPLASNNSLPTTDTNGGSNPTSGSAMTPPNGGSGFLGWLGGIYQALTGTLKAQNYNASGPVNSANPLAVTDPNNASISAPVAITYGTVLTNATRALAWTCSSAGTVTVPVTFANGNSWTVALAAATSEQERGWAITTVGTPTYGGGAAGCTFEGLN